MRCFVLTHLIARMVTVAHIAGLGILSSGIVSSDSPGLTGARTGLKKVSMRTDNFCDDMLGVDGRALEDPDSVSSVSAGDFDGLIRVLDYSTEKKCIHF